MSVIEGFYFNGDLYDEIQQVDMFFWENIIVRNSAYFLSEF
ncbi:hypothetical protein [Ignatzschineria sp. LJL83]